MCFVCAAELKITQYNYKSTDGFSSSFILRLFGGGGEGDGGGGGGDGGMLGAGGEGGGFGGFGGGLGGTGGGLGSGAIRISQSGKSVPSRQVLSTEPSPPSSHLPLLAKLTCTPEIKT